MRCGTSRLRSNRRPTPSAATFRRFLPLGRVTLVTSRLLRRAPPGLPAYDRPSLAVRVAPRRPTATRSVPTFAGFPGSDAGPRDSVSAAARRGTTGRATRSARHGAGISRRPSPPAGRDAHRVMVRHDPACDTQPSKGLPIHRRATPEIGLPRRRGTLGLSACSQPILGPKSGGGKSSKLPIRKRLVIQFGAF